MKNDWQPIETAPKDEPQILLYSAAFPELFDIGWWQNETRDQHESGSLVDAGSEAGWYGCRGMWPGGEQPTHWMPLPPAPRTADEPEPERERDADDGRTYADPRDERDERARR